MTYHIGIVVGETDLNDIRSYALAIEARVRWCAKMARMGFDSCASAADVTMSAQQITRLVDQYLPREEGKNEATGSH